MRKLKLSDMPKGPQLVSGRGRIPPQDSLMSEPLHHQIAQSTVQDGGNGFDDSWHVE